MIDIEREKMVLELSEHDALRLLVLARREIDRASPPWRPYWEYLAQNLLQSIEQAELGPDIEPVLK